MANQISGVIIAINQRPFQKKDGSQGVIKEYVLDASRFNPQTGEKYENYPSVEVSERSAEKMPQLAMGMRVKFDIEISGRYYQDKQTMERKHINSVNAYKAEVLAQAQVQGQPMAQAQQMAQQQAWGAPQGYAQQQGAPF